MAIQDFAQNLYERELELQRESTKKPSTGDKLKGIFVESLGSRFLGPEGAITKAIANPLENWINGSGLAEERLRQFAQNEDVIATDIAINQVRNQGKIYDQIQEDIRLSDLNPFEYMKREHQKEIFNSTYKTPESLLGNIEKQQLARETAYKRFLRNTKDDEKLINAAKEALAEHEKFGKLLENFRIQEGSQEALKKLSVQKYQRNIFQRIADSYNGDVEGNRDKIFNDSVDNYVNSAFGKNAKEAATILKKVQNQGGDFVDGVQSAINLGYTDEKVDKLNDDVLQSTKRVVIKTTIEKGKVIEIVADQNQFTAERTNVRVTETPIEGYGGPLQEEDEVKNIITNTNPYEATRKSLKEKAAQRYNARLVKEELFNITTMEQYKKLLDINQEFLNKQENLKVTTVEANALTNYYSAMNSEVRLNLQAEISQASQEIRDLNLKPNPQNRAMDLAEGRFNEAQGALDSYDLLAKENFRAVTGKDILTFLPVIDKPEEPVVEEEEVDEKAITQNLLYEADISGSKKVRTKEDIKEFKRRRKEMAEIKSEIAEAQNKLATKDFTEESILVTRRPRDASILGTGSLGTVSAKDASYYENLIKELTDKLNPLEDQFLKDYWGTT